MRAILGGDRGDRGDRGDGWGPGGGQKSRKGHLNEMKPQKGRIWDRFKQEKNIDCVLSNEKTDEKRAYI